MKQYFKPAGDDQFVGDCMPFFHDGVFHLCYLLDVNHHSGNGGLGGHIWAHASTRDLVRWEHHPVAVGLGKAGEVDDASICTGSMFAHDGVIYAFYAARCAARPGERVCVATSTDGIHFRKHPTRPILEPSARYSLRSFRDPNVFAGPDGRFHMLVTTCRNAPGLGDRAGCLAHYTSTDLLHWEEHEPFIDGLFGRLEGWTAPECPDYFQWNSHWYVIFGDCSTGQTRYMVSDAWNGPWRSPPGGFFDSGMFAVMKTAAFGGGRRIGAAFIRSLGAATDDARILYAGDAVFRELVQHADGSLGLCWPEEMIPPAARRLALPLTNVRLDGQCPQISLAGVAPDVRIQVRVQPLGRMAAYGLRLRDTGSAGYELRLDVERQEASLLRSDRKPGPGGAGSTLDAMTGLGRPVGLDIILKGDLIDVCIDRRRTVCMRYPELKGDLLTLFVQDGSAEFQDLRVDVLA